MTEPNPLPRHEMEMLVEANRAIARLFDAIERYIAADGALAEEIAKGRPSWGGVVDEWHAAKAEWEEAAAAHEAFEAFAPRAWWKDSGEE